MIETYAAWLCQEPFRLRMPATKPQLKTYNIVAK